MTSTRLALLVVLAGFGACTREPAAPVAGTERAPCRAGSACDPGLTCLSDRCVFTPDGRVANGSGSGSAVTGLTGMPAECIAYVAILERYAGCTKLPPESRKAISDVLVQLKQSWSGLGANPMPPAVVTACRQGSDAIHQAMGSFGC